MLIGYARVSSIGQSLEVQQQALKSAGCEKIFQEKVSGAKSDRSELLSAIAKLKVGDVLVVTRLDRLARSTLDLLRTIDQINKLGAGFKSLADAAAALRRFLSSMRSPLVSCVSGVVCR